MLKTGRRAAAEHQKYMNKFSFFHASYFSTLSLSSLSIFLTHSFSHSENPFLPKSLGKIAETEAKHHTQWYNVFLPPPLLQYLYLYT